MHKIIKDFIESDKSIGSILNDEKQSDQPVEVAFHFIFQHMNREPQPVATNKIIDDALENGHADEEVFLLFVSFLMAFYAIKEMTLKCESAFRISSSFIVSKYRLEIQAFYYQCCAYYFIHTKEFKKREQAIVLSISKMPKDSPRYLDFLKNTSQLLGVYGRLPDLPKTEQNIIEANVDKSFMCAAASLYNALFTVNLKQIDNHFKILQSNSKNDIHFKEDILFSLIIFLKGDFKEQKTISPTLNNCISYYNALKNDDIGKAKLIFGINEGE